MATRNASPLIRGYQPDTDLAYQEQYLLFAFYCLGMSEADLETATIDDVVALIRETYPHDKASPQNAWDNLFHEIQLKLLMNVRRAWFDRQMAKEVQRNG